eukprot:jgi/Picre1/28373/NNA_003778.t1
MQTLRQKTSHHTCIFSDTRSWCIRVRSRTRLRPTSPKAWEMISTELRKNKLKFASVSDAKKRNVVVVDIRPKGEYDKGHVPGSVNVEFFQLIQGWDPVRVARRAVYAFLGS